MKQSAYTLAEVLIALVLLGVVAAFTIPKILQVNNLQRQKAVMKETVFAIGRVFYEGILTGQLTEATSSSYFLSRLNNTTSCDTSASAQGCWDNAKQGNPAHGEHNEPGYISATGAQVVGVNNFHLAQTGWPSNYGLLNAFIVDWNGPSGPNKVGDDQLYIIYCGENFNKNCIFSEVVGGTLGGGKFEAYLPATTITASERAANTALFRSIFED